MESTQAALFFVEMCLAAWDSADFGIAAPISVQLGCALKLHGRRATQQERRKIPEQSFASVLKTVFPYAGDTSFNRFDRESNPVFEQKFD